MFKEKNSKKRIVASEYGKTNSTLDARHQNMMHTMLLNHKRVDELHQSRSNIMKELQILNIQIQDFRLTNCDIESATYIDAWTSNIKLQDEARNIQQQISEYESSDAEIHYYENTGNILFQYYDLIEKQQEVGGELSAALPLPPVRPAKGRKKQPPLPSITILDALLCTAPAPAEDDSNVANAAVGANGATNEPADTAEEDAKTKTALVDEYLAMVDSECLRTVEHDALGNCPTCGTVLACIQNEGAMVCVTCGYQELLLVEQNRPLMRTPNKDASHFSYKRINHFREWLSQVQGLQSTDIPEEIFEQILQEIKKEKIYDMKKLSYVKMREILKKLHINRYYEHINYIINRINGVPTPHFSQELVDKLCSMFKEIQAPFLKYCPSSRKNFLSYSYCIHKQLQILGYTEYQKYFSMLRSRQKLYVQDQIWKQICEELNWPWYPSL